MNNSSLNPFFIAFALISFSILINSCAPPPAAGLGKNGFREGTLDLAGYDFLKDGPLELKGEWDYFPGKYAPGDSKNLPAPFRHLLPGPWPRELTEEKSASGRGTSPHLATFKLQILNANPRENYSILLNREFYKVSVFINGRRLNPDPKGEFLLYRHLEVSFRGATKIELALEVDNRLHSATGHPALPPVFAPQSLIDKRFHRNIRRDFLVIGIILIISLYHLFVFRLDPKERSPLYLSIFTLLLAFRTLIIEGYSWDFVGRNLSEAGQLKLERFFTYGALPAFFLYLKHSFPNMLPRGFITLTCVPVLVLLPLYLLPDKYYIEYQASHMLFEYITLICALYAIYKLIVESVKNRGRGASLILGGFFLLTCTVVNDILNGRLIIQTGTFLHYGVVSLVFAQVLLIARTYIRARLQAEELSRGLESLVEKRTTELDEALSILKKKDRRLQFELDLARSLQKGLMPRLPTSLSNVHIEGTCRPLGQVGGDVYDFFQTPSGARIIMLGDASGHGVNSAFITALAKTAFTSAARLTSSPAAILGLANQDLLTAIQTPDYMTASLLTIGENGEIGHAAAGHPPMLIWRKKNGALEEWKTSSYMLGLFDNALYEERYGRLEPGDRILLYTDGLNEVEDARENALGIKVFHDILGSGRDSTLKELHQAFIHTWEEHVRGGEINDDMTFLLIELN